MSDDIERLTRLRPGDRIAARDCRIFEGVVKQRQGLNRGNERRQDDALRRNYMVRWHYELLAHLNPDDKKETLLRLIQAQWAKVCLRQLYRDLDARSDGCDIDWARQDLDLNLDPIDLETID